MSDDPTNDFPRTFKIRRIPGDVIARERAHPLLADLYLTRAGYFPRAAGHRVARASIDEFIAIYCVAGRGWYATNGQHWPVVAGDFLIVLPGTAHSYGADEDEPWTIHWAHFDGARAADFLELAGITPAQPLFPVGERLGLVTLFMEILQTLQSGYSRYHLLAAAAALRQILSQVALVHRYAPEGSRRDVHVERMISFMLERLDEPLTLDALAAEAAMSRSHFSRRFHDRTGYAPIDYFIRLKMQRAGELLEGSDLSIGEISELLGYTDPYYFSRLFKKIMGAAPTQYRTERG